MPQRPTVRLFVLCADALLHVPESLDLLDGYWELHNPFHTVWMPPEITRNFRVKELFAYVQLTDGIGTFNIGLTVTQLDLLNPKRNRLMGRGDPLQVTLNSPWEVAEKTTKIE